MTLSRLSKTPFEFKLTGYKPDRWTLEAVILSDENDWIRGDVPELGRCREIHPADDQK